MVALLYEKPHFMGWNKAVIHHIEYLTFAYVTKNIFVTS